MPLLLEDHKTRYVVVTSIIDFINDTLILLAIVYKADISPTPQSATMVSTKLGLCSEWSLWIHIHWFSFLSTSWELLMWAILWAQNMWRMWGFRRSKLARAFIPYNLSALFSPVKFRIICSILWQEQQVPFRYLLSSNTKLIIDAVDKFWQEYAPFRSVSIK